MNRSETRKLASSCVLRCEARGLGTLQNRLQTALDLEDYSHRLADRSAEHFQASGARLQRLEELAKTAAATLYEMAQTKIQSDQGDVEVRLCGSFTPTALDKVIARLRVEQQAAYSYRREALQAAAVEVLPMEQLS